MRSTLISMVLVAAVVPMAAIASPPGSCESVLASADKMLGIQQQQLDAIRAKNASSYLAAVQRESRVRPGFEADLRAHASNPSYWCRGSDEARMKKSMASLRTRDAAVIQQADRTWGDGSVADSWERLNRQQDGRVEKLWPELERRLKRDFRE